MAGREIRLPAYSANVRDWLLHVDAFLNQQDEIEDKQKFGALIGALPTSVIATVQHVIIDPPATFKYKALTTALRKRYVKEDDESNYQQLIDITIGDLLPSELLAEMKRLNGRRIAKLPDSIIRTMHLTKLPVDIQTLVDAVGSELQDEQYENLADKVFKRNSKQQLSVNTVVEDEQQNDVHTIRTPANLEVQELKTEVFQLQKLVEKLATLVQSHPRSFEQPPPSRHHQLRDSIPFVQPQTCGFGTPQQNFHNQTRGFGSPQQDYDMCFYHQRFGHRAINCRAPCKFNQGNGQRGGL